MLIFLIVEGVLILPPKARIEERELASARKPAEVTA
jgi:hypothetical protein